MKNRTKTISLLMALCMMITLLPAVALAATPQCVKIGGVELNSQYPYYVNGTNGAVEDARCEDSNYTGEWNAKFENGTLTLKDLNVVNVKNPAGGVRGIWWDTGDLIITLEGENIVTNTRGAAVVADQSPVYSTPSLTIKGSGTLYATGSTSGMWIWKDITIGDNAKVYATGVTKYGIANNSSSGTITIKDYAQVIADGARADSGVDNKKYGIGSEDYIGADIEINVEDNGRLTAFGADGAIQKGLDSCHESTVTAADNVKGENTQEISSSSISDTHKYVAVGNALTLPKYYVFFDRNVNPTDPNPNAPAMAAQYVTSGSLQLANYDANKYWATKDNGSGTSYANQATLTPIRSMILYAQDGSITTFSVSFNAGDGGTGTMATVNGISGKYLLPFNEFNAPANKQFKAWSVENQEYAENAVIDVTKDITVTAVWEDIPTGGSTPTPTPTPTPSTSPDTTDPGTTIPTVDASSGIDLWYNGGNSFGSSKSAVPTSVEIDGVPVVFNGNGREFTVGCISPNAKWVTVNWNSTSVTTNFTPDANAACAEISLPKTGDVSVMAFALMAVVAAAGAMGKK